MLIIKYDKSLTHVANFESIFVFIFSFNKPIDNLDEEQYKIVVN